MAFKVIRLLTLGIMSASVVWNLVPLSSGADGDPQSAAHVHATVPMDYADRRAALSIWTDPAVLAKGRAIYLEKCAVCHGAEGRGNGPAAAALPLKPASFADEVDRALQYAP